MMKLMGVLVIFLMLTSCTRKPSGPLDLKGNVIARYEAGTDPENFVVNDHATRLYIANEDAAPPRSRMLKRIA